MAKGAGRRHSQRLMQQRCVETLQSNRESLKQEQQQYLFAIGGWKPEGHKPIKAGSKKK